MLQGTLNRRLVQAQLEERVRSHLHKLQKLLSELGDTSIRLLLMPLKQMHALWLRVNSKISSKPPSSDLLKNRKTRNSKVNQMQIAQAKTWRTTRTSRKTQRIWSRRLGNFASRKFVSYGHTELAIEPTKVEKQQVAQLAERPIEIVEYHRHSCQCQHCEPYRVQTGHHQVKTWESDYKHFSDGWETTDICHTKTTSFAVVTGANRDWGRTLVKTNQRVEQAIAALVLELSA